MKHAKKLTSLLLALVMLLALGTTAFAAETAGNANGSITIKNATVDKSYSIYKVFDLTYSTSQDETNVAYTYTKNGENDAFLSALQGDDSPFTLTVTPTAGKYTVTLKDGKDAAAISAFLSGQKDNLTAVDTKKADSDTVLFTGLAYGYYFATSEVGTTLTIDSTLPNVEIIDKNQGPTWDNEDPNNPDSENPGKVIVNADGTKTTVNSVNFGDTVNFSVAVNATAYVGDKQATYYYITDTLADGFSAATGIEVYVGGVKKTLDTDYSLIQSGNTFTVTVPYAESYGANAVIEVKYSATVLNTALLADSGNLNKANFTYGTKTPGDPTPTPTPDPEFPSENEKTTTTYVYALGIVKVDPQGNTLKGAEFSVKDAEGNDIWATGDNGVYEYCPADTEGAVKQFTTDDNGVLVIKGVAAGTYSVTEQVAPNGYNLLNGSTNVEAKLKEQYTTKVTTYLDEEGKVTNAVTTSTKDYDAGVNVTGLVIVNNKGTELPSTGGMGTTLFYVLGGVLVVGAAVLLVVKKRMGRAAQ